MQVIALLQRCESHQCVLSMSRPPLLDMLPGNMLAAVMLLVTLVHPALLSWVYCVSCSLANCKVCMVLVCRCIQCDMDMLCQHTSRTRSCACRHKMKLDLQTQWLTKPSQWLAANSTAEAGCFIKPLLQPYPAHLYVQPLGPSCLPKIGKAPSTTAM